ncbi:MAG: hypothetical protein ACJA1Z_002806 [Patiriisocius sp.]
MLELKALASSSTTSHIPYISGVSASTVDTLSTAIKYLSWSDILVNTQLILITLSKSITSKVALVIAIIGSFISKYRTTFLKIVVLFLLINPGLPAYIKGVKYLAQEAKLDFGNDLTQVLLKTHANYKKRESKNKKHEELRNQKQMETAESKGRDKVFILKQIEDKVSDDIKKVDNRVIEGVTQAHQVITIAAKEISIKSINLFTSILIQFFLLPFLYFFGLFTLYKTFITATVIDTFLEKVIICETTAVAIILAIILI